jgi:16S rRNA C967 or C1407 C5-methylase (RsmB/RsmF family)
VLPIAEADTSSRFCGTDLSSFVFLHSDLLSMTATTDVNPRERHPRQGMEDPGPASRTDLEASSSESQKPRARLLSTLYERLGPGAEREGLEEEQDPPLPRFVRINPRKADVVSKHRHLSRSGSAQGIYVSSRITAYAAIDNSDWLQAAVTTALHEAGGAVVPWFPGGDFFQLPAIYPLGASQLFVSGDVYGMDVSSGVAVLALDPQPGKPIV